MNSTRRDVLSQSPDSLPPATAGLTRRNFLRSAFAGIVLVQAGCIAAMKNLLEGKKSDQKPVESFPPANGFKTVPEKPISAPTQAPKEPSAAEQIARSMEQARKAENEADELFAYASKRIDSTDFKKMGELSRRIQAEVKEFRTNPTAVQQTALSVSYAEYEMQHISNLMKAFKLLDMALASYVFAIDMYQILLSKNSPQVEPHLKQISGNMQRLVTKRERVMQLVKRAEDEFVAAQVVDIPPWSEIEKIPVKDETPRILTSPPPEKSIVPRILRKPVPSAPSSASDNMPYTDEDLFPPQNKE